MRAIISSSVRFCQNNNVETQVYSKLIIMLGRITNILSNKHFKFGLPFLIMVVGGSFCLEFYSQLRYDLLKEKRVVTKTKEVLEVTGQKPKSLEMEHQDYLKKVDLDAWENIRGPRPWEDDNVEYKEMIERRAKEQQNKWVFKK